MSTKIRIKSSNSVRSALRLQVYLYWMQLERNEECE